MIYYYYKHIPNFSIWGIILSFSGEHAPDPPCISASPQIQNRSYTPGLELLIWVHKPWWVIIVLWVDHKVWACEVYLYQFGESHSQLVTSVAQESVLRPILLSLSIFFKKQSSSLMASLIPDMLLTLSS